MDSLTGLLVVNPTPGAMKHRFRGIVTALRIQRLSGVFGGIAS